MTPAEETNERNACDEWWHAEKRGASVQQAWLERARRAEADARDAARYRWLRGHLGWSVLFNLFGSPSGPGYTMDGIDTEIDDAISWRESRD